MKVRRARSLAAGIQLGGPGVIARCTRCGEKLLLGTGPIDGSRLIALAKDFVAKHSECPSGSGCREKGEAGEG